MGDLSFKKITFVLTVFLLLLLSWSNVEACRCRRAGRHRRHTRKSHSSHHHRRSKVTSPRQTLDAAVFNVLDFGAVGYGATDDTKAFRGAWAAACRVEASVIEVPVEYVFLVGPISFTGRFCQHNIVFQLDGTIVAPKIPRRWGSGLLYWLEFKNLVGLTIRGSGTIDGNGDVWWQKPTAPLAKHTSPSKGTPRFQRISGFAEKMPTIKPAALRFHGSFNVTVTGITIQKSAQYHLRFDNCIGVSAYNITVSSPGYSPNTDGIHLQKSKDVIIHTSNISSGGGCVSIQTGSANVYIHNIRCQQGHGISIGGLGRNNTKACVRDITVRDVILQNTKFGVRINTWQGGSGSVQGIEFSNIQVSEVQSPIVIDQFYCDRAKCKNQTSAVEIAGINYENIYGTYTVKPVYFACSDSKPCVDVTLTNIRLFPHEKKNHVYDPYCWQTFGHLYSPIVPPVKCVQTGRPLSSAVHGGDDPCEL